MTDKTKIFLVILTVFIDLLGFSILIPLGPIYAKSLGITPAQWGYLMMIYSLMQFIFVPLLAKWSDSIGRRPVLLITIIFSVVGHLIFASSHHFPHPIFWLFLSRSIAGIGGANIAVAQAYLSDITSEKDRHKTMGLIGASFGLGFTIGPAIAGPLAKLGMSVPFYFAAGFSLVNFVMAYFSLPESHKVQSSSSQNSVSGSTSTQNENNDDEDLSHRPVSAALHNFTKSLRLAVFSYSCWRPYLLTFVLLMGFSMLEVSYVYFALEKFSATSGQITLLFSLIGIQLVFIQGGLIRILSKYLSEKTLIPIGLFLMSSGLIIIPFVPSFLGLLLTTPFITLGNGLVQPSVSSYISKIAWPKHRGLLLGFNQSSGAMARIFGPAIGGELYMRISINTPFYFGSLLLLIGCLIGWSLKKPDELKLAVEN